MRTSEVLWHLLASIWDHSLFQLGLFLCFPFLLNYSASFFSSGSKSAAGKAVSQTRWQKAARWFAVSFALLELTRAWNLWSTDVFCEVRPLPDNYAFAWHFERYLDRQIATDPAGFKAEQAEWTEARLKSRQTEDSGTSARAPSVIDPELGAEPATRAARLLTLKEVLADKSARKFYYTFGEDAALRCPWCSEPSDYLAFYLPSLLFHYAQAAVVIGTATCPRRKRHWRTPLVVGLLLAAGVDIYILVDGEGDILRELPCSMPTKTAWFRHGFFAAITFLAALARGCDDVRTDAEVVAELCNREEALLNRSHASALLGAAVTTDSNLRKVQSDHYQRREVERNLLASDDEIVSATERAKQRLDLEKIMTDIEAYVEQVVGAASGISQIDT